MKLHNRNWRLAAAAVASIVVMVGVMTACASAKESAPAASPTAAPVTITHKFGVTSVPANPSRVVTVGWTDQDFVLPFGVVPVSTRTFASNYNDLPWVKAATDGRGVTTWGGEDSIDFEAIAAQKPDLIFAIYETVDKQTYDRLSQIAPTVIQSADFADEETPWDVQLLTTGTALGKAAQAKELVGRVQGKIDEIKKANPEFEGKTAVVDLGPSEGGHYLLAENDPRRSLFTALGFKTQYVVGDISEEKLALLDSDVLFIDGATKEDMLASPAFARLGVVRDNRTLYTNNESNLNNALTYSGPDSLLYALDVLTPQLANAVGGRPVADLATA